jgi:hypothetical protein
MAAPCVKAGTLNVSDVPRCEIIESINAPKFEYFLWKYGDSEIQSIQPKKGTPRMLMITEVFEEKTMLRLQNKKE